MKDLPRFIKIGDDRINVEEIVSYGISLEFDDDEEEIRSLYVETKTSEDFFQYDEDDIDFDIDEKISELDNLLLIKKIGSVDFK